MTITLKSIPFPKDTVEVEHFGEGTVYLRTMEVEGMGDIPALATIRVSVDELREAVNEVAGKRPIPEPAGKSYRPQDRDRHLRHIEDVEATLARRNIRHEQDQERIRELEAEVKVAEARADAAEAKFHDDPMTARELLELAWDQAIMPEDGMIHEGEAYLAKSPGEDLPSAYSPAPTSRPSGTAGAYERRLLDPRPEPTTAEKRQALIDGYNLSDWEVALLGWES